LLRTHSCGELRREHIGQEVTLCGWVDSSRDHGGAVFVDLRDRYGKTQVVFAPEGGTNQVDQAGRLRSEDVIRVTGKVAPRPEGTANPKLATGEVELRCQRLQAAQASLSRFAPRIDATHAVAAQPHHQVDARLF
jgi:aspartyl-tRNA synthetase